MNLPEILVTCGSWEDRFRLGTERALQTKQFDEAVVFFYQEYERRSRANIDLVVSLLEAKGTSVHLVPQQMSTPQHNWRRVQTALALFQSKDPDRRCAHLDLSTMPRELLWTSLWTLEQKQIPTEYVYNRPAQYGNDWLSREPSDPRLVLKLSGISRLGRKTALNVVAGADTERVSQMLKFFEPTTTALFLQSDSSFSTNRMWMDEHRSRFGKRSNIEIVEIDVYAADHGLSTIKEKVANQINQFNVIVASLGPKISGISVYETHRLFREVGIVYAPSRQFNKDYSTGIGSSIKGRLSFAPVHEVASV